MKKIAEIWRRLFNKLLLWHPAFRGGFSLRGQQLPPQHKVNGNWQQRLALTETALNQLAGEVITFLQVGANDGATGDRVGELARQHNWQGWCLEPHPTAFAALKQNYAESPHVKACQYAVAEQSGEVEMWLSDLNTRLSSLNRDVILKAEHQRNNPGLADDVKAVRVPAITLQDFFAQEQITALDVLFLDTEGFDGKIVLQLLNTTPVRPELIVFEHRHLSMGEVLRVIAQLKQAGYTLRECVTDIIAVCAAATPPR